jgi:hypothetical protein
MDSSDPAALLDALDVADDALRETYLQLARDPDRASELEPALRELHGRRLELAQRLGLAILAQRRRATVVDVVPGAVAAEPATTRAETAPVVEPEEEVSAPPPPASAADVAQWKSAVASTGLGPRLDAAPSETTAWPLVLHELMTALGAPRSLSKALEIIDETEALEAVTAPERQEPWARLPRRMQQLWLAALVARTRALKDLPASDEGLRTRVKAIIGRYPPWAATYNPGHVNGMQVKHVPRHGTWLQDARECWSELDALLGEELAVSAPASSAPKKKAKRVASDEDDEPDIDPAWPVLPLLRGKRALILGGDPREPNRQRLERALQLTSLDWPSVDGPRKVDAIVERIRRGTCGLVLVLKPFVAHQEATPIIDAAKDSGVPWALVDGYGLAAVKLGLERFLGGSRDARAQAG